MKLGEKLTALRKKQGMNQRALAERLHVTRQAVSGWERGTALPALDNLTALAKLFGVPLEVLTDDSAPLPEAPGPQAETPEKKPAEEAAEEEPPKGKPAQEKAERKNRLKKRAALALAAAVLLLVVAASAVYLWRILFPETPEKEDGVVWQEDILPEVIDESDVVDLTEGTVNVIP